MWHFIRQTVRYLLLKRKYPDAYASFDAVVALNTKLGRGSYVNGGAVLNECVIARYTYIGGHCSFGKSEVGPFTSVGPRVICGLASHPIHFVSTYPGFYTDKVPSATWFGASIAYEDQRKVFIGADVFIGACAMILGGVRIGHGAVIGAGAVVTKDIPPYGIVAGVPAKIVRYRFEEPMIQKLLASKWWEAPENVLRAIAPYAADTDVFLEHLGKIWVYDVAPKGLQAFS
jgi:acetyltransferase-like isoleucine patch superfamily enzyme